MTYRFHLLRVAIAAAMALCAALSMAQNYPSRTVRIMTTEPGAANDFTARMIAPDLSTLLGQPVVVENKPGASGILVIEAVSKAPPDGYTLLVYNNGMWTLPLMQKVPYDVIRDFAPIILTSTTPNVVVVHPSLGVNSVAELIALAKSKGGELNYASGGTGSSNHLATELF